MDDILRNKRSPFDKYSIGIGINQKYGSKTLTSPQEEVKDKPRSHRHATQSNQQKGNNQKRYEFREFASKKCPSLLRHTCIFLGTCYLWNNIGHKVVNCKVHQRNP